MDALKPVRLGSFILSLLGCLAISWVAADAAAAVQKTNDTNGYTFGNYWLPAWTQNFNFNNGSTFTRTWDGNTSQDRIDYLWVNYKQTSTSTSVGFDAGVGRNVATGTKVADLSGDGVSKINRGVYYKFTNNLVPQNGGYWWMGPKTLIYQQNQYSNSIGLNNQYECYIVDNASISRSQMVSQLGLTYRGQGNYDGSTYYHYTVRLGNINQVWSIRGNFRNQGWVSTNWIQRQWYQSGLVPWNYYNLGWKMNVEMAGKFAPGDCGFTHLNLPWN